MRVNALYSRRINSINVEIIRDSLLLGHDTNCLNSVELLTCYAPVVSCFFLQLFMVILF